MHVQNHQENCFVSLGAENRIPYRILHLLETPSLGAGIDA